MLIKISLSLLSCAAVAVNFVGLHKILDQVAVYYSNKINLSLVFRRELYSSIFASTCWICKKLYRLSSWGRTLWSEKKFDLIFEKGGDEWGWWCKVKYVSPTYGIHLQENITHLVQNKVLKPSFPLLCLTFLYFMNPSYTPF